MKVNTRDNAEAKEQILSEIRTLLFDKVVPSAISTIIDCVSYAMRNYDFKEKETAMVVYDTTDRTITGKFFVAKSVEGLSENSLQYYRIILSGFLKHTGKHVKDITSDDARLYLLNKKMENCTDCTLNNIRRVLSSFFTWCFAEGITRNNPISRIKSVKCTKKIKKALSEDEMECLRYAAKTRRNRAIVEFLYSTGCRVSEICSINRDDIDVKNGEVMVLGKGRKYRTVYLSARCKAVLQEYLDNRTDDNPALFVTDAQLQSGKLKTNYVATRMQKGGVEGMCRTIGRIAGIENVHPHRFRRTAATIALRRGMPIEQVQKMLGHEDIQTTTIYAQSTQEDIKVAHEKYVI